MELVIGRFAPSPTGPLHVGNLRTALAAWLFAHSSNGEMLVRIEDLDRANSSTTNEVKQLEALSRLGMSHPPVTVRQSERFDRYRDVIDELAHRDLVYPCYCSRREIREAASAPHGAQPEGGYLGTCRNLSERQRNEREVSGRRPALRLRTDGELYVVNDVIAGLTTVEVDDFVLQRNDSVPAYNLAVVVDDADQGVTQVVRGDDLLFSTGRQIHLQKLLNMSTPQYAHVPLVVGGDGERLAKRHGAVTLDGLNGIGVDNTEVLRVLGSSLGVEMSEARSAAELLPFFEPQLISKSPWMIPPHWQGLAPKGQ